MGFHIEDSPVPIVSVRPLPGLDLRLVQKQLQEQGVMVKYVPPRGYSDAPSVETLRIAVFSEHTPEQLDRLVDALQRAIT